MLQLTNQENHRSYISSTKAFIMMANTNKILMMTQLKLSIISHHCADESWAQLPSTQSAMSLCC